MSRAPRPRKAIPEAISLARLRGKVQVTGNRREALFHFAIITADMVAFVRARFAERIMAPADEIAAEYKSDIARLRAVVQAGVISRELWLRSRDGTWRFFRIVTEGLVEISRDGTVPAAGDAGATAW